MTFERAWVLVLTILPLLWVAWEWRRVSNKIGLALKALAIILALLALAEPRLGVWETKMAVAVLVDTSASVTEEDLTAASPAGIGAGTESRPALGGRHPIRKPHPPAWRRRKTGRLEAAIRRRRRRPGDQSRSRRP